MDFSKFSSIGIGPVNIQIWGLLVAVGMLFALLLAVKEAKKKKMNSENFIDIFIIIFIAAIIGSRLFYVGEHWDMFKDDWLGIIKLNYGGLVFIGGALLASVSVLAYTKLKKLSFWKSFDIIAPGAALAIAIGRIGDYLIGSNIGSRTSFFLGSYYQGDLRNEPSLYLAINALILFLFLILLKPFVKREGLMAYIFIVWYAIARFLIDFTRSIDLDTLSDPRYVGLTITQWICIGLFIIFVPLLSLKIAKGKK
ncbi:prolipoprotein diacylglyceryl transferase [bacterium]|nr:prolipoprotein diacylglyceryl transferase [bacterium]